MDHDQMCPATLGRYVSGTGFTSNECQCWLIRKVRADERERAIAEVQEKHRYEVARLIAEARADQDNRECDHCTDLARLKVADLRAKVEALPHTNKCDTQDPVYAGRGKTLRCTCWQAEVLDLFDGSSDERE